MSKQIKLTDQQMQELQAEFLQSLRTTKMSDGKINFSKSLVNNNRKATLYFKEWAYHKMLTLVREFDTEVAWHGIATRGENAEKDEYIISDILVYPQTISGATVTTDQEKYQTWLIQQPDEVFNNIRMQGHSHVNFGTTPSGVDTALYQGILNQLDDTMFYIFLIWNKKGEHTVMIYDMAKNTLFENFDVIIEVLPDENGLIDFLKQAKELAKAPQPFQKAVYAKNGKPVGTYKATAVTAVTKPSKPAQPSRKGYTGFGQKPKGKQQGALANAYDDDAYEDYWNYYNGY